MPSKGERIIKTTRKLIFFMAALLVSTTDVYALTPRDELKKMVKQLQSTPENNALREQIIKLAKTIKPAPVLPQPAKFVKGRAQLLLENAKSPADYLDVAKEYDRAIAAAPWVASYYSDLCTIYKKAEKYMDAKKACEIFLASTHSVKEADKVRDRLALLEVAINNAIVVGEAEAKIKPGKVFKDCPDCPEMAVIPASGIVQAFAMGKTEVTQGQWRSVMGNNPSYFSLCGDTCPVEQVSWDDAKEFILRLNGKTGKQYRLPSEMEWEYACRAGEQQEYCGSNSVDNVAWYVSNSEAITHPVAGKQPNALGMFDMSGNVWEWVEDCFGEECVGRVLRGGSWVNSPQDSRASISYGYVPSFRGGIGFRLACTLL